MPSRDNVIPFPGTHRADNICQVQTPEQLARELAERLVADSEQPSEVLAMIHEIVWRLVPVGGEHIEGDVPVKLTAPMASPRPAERARYVIRVDLHDARPPIWRRLSVASDLTLDQLHEVLQIAMGWSGGHLHRFRVGSSVHDFSVMPFLPRPEIELGELGVNEDQAHLDELLTRPGDRLFYDYDFGDGWVHVVKLERSEPWDDAAPSAECLGGRRACPPEDVGGIGSYTEILAALASDEPPELEMISERLAWLPEGFDPAAFDPDGVNRWLRDDPGVRVEHCSPEIPRLLARVRLPKLTMVAKQALARSRELTDDEVAQAVRRYEVLLRTLDSGLKLTAAGYMPPRVVQALQDELGLGDEFIGKGSREDITLPVKSLRESATAMGLLRKAKGVLSVTRAGRGLARDPRRLFDHIRSQLPIGRDFERDAGLIALLFVAAGHSWWHVRGEAVEFLEDLGWRVDDGKGEFTVGYAARPTEAVLDHLSGGKWASAETKTLLAKALLRRRPAC